MGRERVEEKELSQLALLAEANRKLEEAIKDKHKEAGELEWEIGWSYAIYVVLEKMNDKRPQVELVALLSDMNEHPKKYRAELRKRKKGSGHD